MNTNIKINEHELMVCLFILIIKDWVLYIFTPFPTSIKFIQQSPTKLGTQLLACDGKALHCDLIHFLVVRCLLLRHAVITGSMLNGTPVYGIILLFICSDFWASFYFHFKE
jgi:hypothetical protein